MLCLAASFGATAQTQQVLPSSATGLCGSLESSFGPYDYRTARQEDIKIVERHHFTPQVEMLQRGQSSTVAGDLAYTLAVFPNHHRALYAMMRLAERRPLTREDGARYPMECYFDRAIRFQPNDAQVRVLYANYLARTKRRDEAETHLKAAEEIAPTDSQIVYNIGLGYLELESYDKALLYAHKAYAAGVEFPGLRDRLKRAGRWRDVPR